MKNNNKQRATRRQHNRRMKQRALATSLSIKDADHLASGAYNGCRCDRCIDGISQHVQERKAIEANANWQGDLVKCWDDCGEGLNTYDYYHFVDWMEEHGFEFTSRKHALEVYAHETID